MYLHDTYSVPIVQKYLNNLKTWFLNIILNFKNQNLNQFVVNE